MKAHPEDQPVHQAPTPLGLETGQEWNSFPWLPALPAAPWAELPWTRKPVFTAGAPAQPSPRGCEEENPPQIHCQPQAKHCSCAGCSTIANSWWSLKGQRKSKCSNERPNHKARQLCVTGLSGTHRSQDQARQGKS